MLQVGMAQSWTRVAQSPRQCKPLHGCPFTTQWGAGEGRLGLLALAWVRAACGQTPVAARLEAVEPLGPGQGSSSSGRDFPGAAGAGLVAV